MNKSLFHKNMGSSLEDGESSTSILSSCPTAQSPSTPITPLGPTTPMLMTHLFGAGSMLEDLHLAAELGKTLLERNRELETSLKELRTALDDKTQQVEYLSKQTTALREVNDSRLRIYEQLEISIQDLEKNNQRLNAENTADKRKIKSLNEVVEQLELKCEELKTNQAELTSSLRDVGSPPGSLYGGSDGSGTPRGKRTSQAEEFLQAEILELKNQVEELENQIKATNRQYISETKRREDLEIQISCLSQENYGLKEQLAVFKDNQFTSTKHMEDDLTSPDTTTSSMFCRKCMGLVDETGSNLTMQDISEDFEELNEMIEVADEDCTLVRLKNGGYAWGSQESMTSLGLARCRNELKMTSSEIGTDDKPHNSLLSELDSQYRILIEKYESLVEGNLRDDCESSKNYEPESLVHMGVDEGSGPMGFVMTTAEPVNLPEDKQYSCRRCVTCTCDIKTSSEKMKHSEDFAEVDTASSGFSEEEKRFCAKSTQTECSTEELSYDFLGSVDDVATPVAYNSNFQFLDLKSPINPCETRFQNAPEVQKLFSEIFENLKKTSDSPNCENDAIVSTNVFGKEDNNCRKSRSSNKKSNKENKQPIEIVDENQRNEINCGFTRPNRPDSLDIETTSTCSSRSRRRRRNARAKSHEKSKSSQEIETKHIGGVSENKLPNLKTEHQQQINMDEKQPNINIGGTNPNQVSNISSDSQKVDSNSANVSSSTQPDKWKTTKCPHKQRKKKHSKSKQNQLQNKHLNSALGRNSPSRSQVRSSHSAYGPNNTPKLDSTVVHPLPSVQVAKLIRVEKSYAEVLKSKPLKY